MRRQVIVSALLIFGNLAWPKDRRAPLPFPERLVVARHAFFDFGPPNDYYELLLVKPGDNAISIERIILTPATDACFLPAKVETKTATATDSVEVLLGSKNPCAIPEKDLHRELKRKKKGLVFSGADIAIQVQCGPSTRVIRADILDRDMFDPAPNTPPQTSWTMQLLGRLDKALGPGVMDKPIFPVAEEERRAAKDADSTALGDVSIARYDTLFAGAPDKPSDLYLAAQIRSPTPTVRVVNSSPVRAEESGPPQYPQLAKAAHIEGTVTFKVDVDTEGRASNFTLVRGIPCLCLR